MCAATRLLREFHEATRGCELAGTHEVVCHNDPGPNNAVFGEADLPYAFIDFDFAAPGAVLRRSRVLGLGLVRVVQARAKLVSGQAAQVRLVADSYGLDSGRRSRLLDAIIERQLRNETFWASHCASELPSLLTREKMREMVTGPSVKPRSPARIRPNSRRRCADRYLLCDSSSVADKSRFSSSSDKRATSPIECP